MSNKFIAAYKSIKENIETSKCHTLLILDALAAANKVKDDPSDDPLNEKWIVASAYSAIQMGVDAESAAANSDAGYGYISFYNAMALADQMGSLDYMLEAVGYASDVGDSCASYYAEEVAVRYRALRAKL